MYEALRYLNFFHKNEKRALSAYRPAPCPTIKVYMPVCERERVSARERERERESARARELERERGREKGGERDRQRETEGEKWGRICIVLHPTPG